MVFFLRRADLFHPASTGPRPRGRGMMAMAGKLRSRWARFNGATPTRAWNGARPTSSALGPSLLQRGHAHAGVECVWLRPVRTGENCCFNGATPTRAWNVNGRGVGVLGDDPLQRGHAHAGVECVHAVRDPRGVKRFNGATPTRAWNARAAPSTTSSPLSLQRGHAHAGVE